MSLRALLVSSLLLAAVSTALGAPPGARDGLEFSYTLVHQPQGKLDTAGEFAVDRHLLRLGGSRSPGGALTWGWQLGGEIHRYRFDDSAAASLPTAWTDLYRLELGGNLLWRLTQHTSVMVAPSLALAGAEDADPEKALTGGGILSFGWQGEDLRLGLGGAVFAGLEELSVFPVLVLDWRIDETWRLANPLRAGPTGAAGLELSARLPQRWEAGLGGAWRSYRFRLAPDAAVPHGLVDEQMVPVWLRLGKGLGPLRVDLYGGTALARQLIVEDRHGDRLARRDVDPAPFFAVTLTARF